MKWNKYLDSVIDFALKEDIGQGDITTNYIIPESTKAKAFIIIKSEGIISGLDVIKRIYKKLDSNIILKKFVNDGSIVKSNQIVAEIKGSAKTILSAERVSLNFLQRMSGISTLTNRFINEIKHTNAKILDTRKTAPCLRYFDKYAVKIGGGQNHRFGLFDMILIKDNHINVSGSISNAVNACRTKIKKFNKKILIEVETKNLAEVQEAIDNKVDIIMLDNFNLKMLKKAVALVDGRIKTEASGGINLNNVKKVAETGVDFISIGALTHSVNAMDISLDVRIL